MRYDVAIIGSGPAGLEAAITLKIRKKNIILFGKKDSSAKVRLAEKIDNYLGIPAVSGSELADPRVFRGTGGMPGEQGGAE